MSDKKSPFDPPAPEPTKPLQVAGAVGLAAAAVAVDVATGGWLSFLGMIDGPAEARKSTPAPIVVEGTAAVNRDDRGHAQCTRCSVYVAYDSMSFNEDGYFCSECAAALVARASDSLDPA